MHNLYKGDYKMKTLTAIIFAAIVGFAGTASAEIDVKGQFPWPDTYNPANEDVNCEERCYIPAWELTYPQSDPNDTSNDDVNAEK